MPQRRCVGCGRLQDRDNLIRFTAIEDGRLAFDPGAGGKGGLGGRGAYLCRDMDCARAACGKKGVFSRALRAEVGLPGEGEFMESFGALLGAERAGSAKVC